MALEAIRAPVPGLSDPGPERTLIEMIQAAGADEKYLTMREAGRSLANNAVEALARASGSCLGSGGNSQAV